jgi:hypothetical protein
VDCGLRALQSQNFLFTKFNCLSSNPAHWLQPKSLPIVDIDLPTARVFRHRNMEELDHILDSPNTPRALPIRGYPTPPDSTTESNIDETEVFSTLTDENVFPLPPIAQTVRVLDIDKPTPDSHVPRDPRLIRLTGVHPFNVEAPLKDLFDEGFLTSPNLFYVRNHGPVPKVEDHEIFDWTFTIEGCGF